MDQLTITKPQLVDVLAQWEQDHRDGKCLSYEEAASKSVAQIAAENAEQIWAALAKG